MELKVRKIGNSLGVILPAEVLAALQLEEGDKMTLMPNEQGFQITAEDAEFDEQMQRARALMVRYRQTLRELAK
ncbi:MAG: AbrB/MazE/SpoVT family DNA-binding domain-containing protein [Planctomycetota bacterium]